MTDDWPIGEPREFLWVREPEPDAATNRGSRGPRTPDWRQRLEADGFAPSETTHPVYPSRIWERRCR
jgi:hypothetical protein